MGDEDCLKSIEKKLEIAHCTDKEKVPFAAHQLFGTAVEWWEMYRNSHQEVGAITWNELKARFRTHYVPRGTLKLKKEFSELQQDGMTVNVYLNKFTQISRYAPDEVNTDEKKQDAFLNGLNDEIQFQLLYTDYRISRRGRQGYHYQKQDQRDGEEWQEQNIVLGTNFGKQHPTSLASVRAFLQKPKYGSPVDAWSASSITHAMTKLSGIAPEHPKAEASATGSLTQCAATVSPECTARPTANRSNLTECTAVMTEPVSRVGRLVTLHGSALPNRQFLEPKIKTSHKGSRISCMAR
jgi:hypothetical protein